MKSYREAKTDKEKARGKSTDELSFDEALRFFKKRGKEKGASRFRWRGDSYDLEGNKVTKPKSKSKPAPKTSTKERSETKKETGGRGDGLAEMARRAIDKPSKSTDSGQEDKAKATRSSTESLGIDRMSTKRFTDAEWHEMSRARRRALNLPVSDIGWQMSDRRLTAGKVRAEEREEAREEAYGNRSSNRNSRGNRNYNKGGMVKSGNKDYKKSGMFYKSGSPRGYK